MSGRHRKETPDSEIKPDGADGNRGGAHVRKPSGVEGVEPRDNGTETGAHRS